MISSQSELGRPRGLARLPIGLARLTRATRTAVSGMLDRRSVVDHDEGERLTTCAVGRDGPGCDETAFQLRSTQHSLTKAWHSSPSAPMSHYHAAHGGSSTCSIDEALLTTMKESG